MSHGLDAPVLVLNRSFAPVRITRARQAFEMLYMGRALALDSAFDSHDFGQWMALGPSPYHELVGTPSGGIRVPRLLLLTTYNRVPRAPVRLSRRSLFLRDGYQCQYCGECPPLRDLNIDHVIPRSRGGPSTWENLVTSCRTCNLRKGRLLTHECGMVPLNSPVRPRWTLAIHLNAASRRFAEWEPFLPAVDQA